MEAKIWFATHNAGKLKDVEKQLGLPVNHADIDLPEIQEMDRVAIAKKKAEEAYRLVQKPVFVLDTSLSLEALNGFPGPLIKWFWKTVGGEKMCRIVNCLGDYRASVFITIGFSDGTTVSVFEGETPGRISDRPRGTNGFAWDPVFIPAGHDRTFAEMTHEEKIKVFSENQAWKAFKSFLKSRIIS